jgi:hypothetical protein
MKESTSFSPPLQLSHRWRHRCATRRRLRCSTCGLRFCKRPSDFQPIVNQSITSGWPSKHVNLFCTIDLELNYISTQRRDGAVLCKCPQTVLRTPPPVTLTPTRPHPRSPPNPNQLPPRPLSPPPRRRPHPPPSPRLLSCSHASVGAQPSTARSGRPWSCAEEQGAQRYAGKMRGGAERAGGGADAGQHRQCPWRIPADGGALDPARLSDAFPHRVAPPRAGSAPATTTPSTASSSPADGDHGRLRRAVGHQISRGPPTPPPPRCSSPSQICPGENVRLGLS